MHLKALILFHICLGFALEVIELVQARQLVVLLSLIIRLACALCFLNSMKSVWDFVCLNLLKVDFFDLIDSLH